MGQRTRADQRAEALRAVPEPVSYTQLAGYTHSSENTGDTDMLTLMLANEGFDPAHPDTLRLPVLETPAEAKEND